MSHLAPNLQTAGRAREGRDGGQGLDRDRGPEGGRRGGGEARHVVETRNTFDKPLLWEI